VIPGAHLTLWPLHSSSVTFPPPRSAQSPAQAVKPRTLSTDRQPKHSGILFVRNTYKLMSMKCIPRPNKVPPSKSQGLPSSPSIPCFANSMVRSSGRPNDQIRGGTFPHRALIANEHVSLSVTPGIYFVKRNLFRHLAKNGRTFKLILNPDRTLKIPLGVEGIIPPLKSIR